MDTQKQLHENISALVDGELAPAEIELTLAALDTEEGRAAWNAYHQIGHTLRSDACGSELSKEFAARLALCLAAEAPLRAAAVARRNGKLAEHAEAMPAPEAGAAPAAIAGPSGPAAASATTLP